MQMDISVLEGSWNHHDLKIVQYTGGASERTQHIAVRGDTIFIANRRKLLRRVLDAPESGNSMQNSSEYRWLMSRGQVRNASDEELHWFVPRKFWRNTFSPRQRISIWRRAEARAELQSVSAAALLYRWLQGKLPTHAIDMVRLGVISTDELVHHNGAQIRYDPVRGVSSSWGSLWAMKPISDVSLSAPTQFEKEAYTRLAAEVDTTKDARLSLGGSISDASSRTAEILSFPAPAHLRIPAIHAYEPSPVLPAVRVKEGFQVTADVDQQSHFYSRILSLAPESFALSEWSGRWASIGVIDDGVSPNALAPVHSLFETPIPWWEQPYLDALLNTPWFVMLPVDKPIRLARALTETRQYLEAMSTLNIAFERGPIHRMIQSIRVDLTTIKGGETHTFYYALAEDVLVAAHSKRGLLAAIDARLDAGRQMALSIRAGLAVDLSWGTKILQRHAQRLRRSILAALPRSPSARSEFGVRDAMERKIWLGVPDSHLSERAHESITEAEDMAASKQRGVEWPMNDYSGVHVDYDIFGLSPGPSDLKGIRASITWRTQ